MQALSTTWGLDVDYKSFNSAIGAVNKLDRQVGGAVRGLQKIAGVFAVGGIAAGVFSFAKAAVDAYAKEELAVRRLEAQLRSLGITSQKAARDYYDYAAVLERTSMETIENILATEKLLISTGLQGDALKKATRAALDLSVGMGISLTDATKMAAKAAMGMTEGFKRAGIEIEATTPKAKVLDEFLRQVNVRFGGQSQAEVFSYAGKIKLLRQQFEDIQKSIGKGLMPAASQLIQWLKDLGTNAEVAAGALVYLLTILYKKPPLETAEKELDRLRKRMMELRDEAKKLEQIDISAIGVPGVKRPEPIIYNPARLAVVKKELAEITEQFNKQVSLVEKMRPAEKPGAVKVKPEWTQADQAKADIYWLGLLAERNEKDLADAKKKRDVLRELDAELNSERGQAYQQFFDSVEISSRRAWVAEAAGAQEAANRQKAVLQELSNAYEESGRTLAGGFQQAFIEMDIAGTNWKNNFEGMVSSATSNFASGLREAADTAQGVFDFLDKAAASLFDSIKNAFFDLLAQMAARAAVYGIFNLLTGGMGGGLFKFLGFAQGGLVPGTKGAPRLALVHGGEYVLPSGLVEAIRAGQAAPVPAIAGVGLGGGMNLNMGGINISVSGVGSPSDARAIAGEIAEAARRGVTWAVEHSKIAYKVGQKRAGETSL